MTTDNSVAVSVRPVRILHTMLRVADLKRSISFYTKLLGMRLLRREAYPDGQFTLAFIGYGDERTNAVIELTHNWGRSTYEQGTAFGHIALSVVDLNATVASLEASSVTIVRAPGPMAFSSDSRLEREAIAFIADPDGYRIELIQTR